MLGKFTEEESQKFLENHIYGRLGCHAFGKTYVVPISYAHKDGKIFCHTLEGQKLDMMRENPDVCFQVDTLSDPSNWKSVIVQGTFKELEGKEKTEGLKILLNRKIFPVVSETVKLSSDWPFFSEEKLKDISGIVFSIEIKEISGRFEKSDPVER